MSRKFINILPAPIFLLLCLAFCHTGKSQQNSVAAQLSCFQTTASFDSLARLHLRHVIIMGNRKTKDFIINREMHLKPGDSIVIARLNDEMEKDRQHIYNTTLFAEVNVEPLIISAFDFDIIVSVKERWYIYPEPEFSIVDQSYDQWLRQYKGDLNRVNYGFRFTHRNLTGRKDPFSLAVMNGYSRSISANYNLPYIDASLTHGISVQGGFSQSREVAYKTGYNNQFIIYKREQFVKNEWNIQLTYSLRKAIKLSQYFTFRFAHLRLDDSLITTKYNASFFNKATSSISFPELIYTIQYVDVNNILYPLKGTAGHVFFVKRGVGLTGGINMFGVLGEYDRYWSLGKKWYASEQLLGSVKLPFKQPYYNQPAIGYDNAYLRGLEYYMIDCVAYGILRSTVKRELFNFTVPFLKKSKTFNHIPFHIYGKSFVDVGYNYLKENYVSRLNNRFLYTGGIGIDIVTFYDIQFRFEYSLNQLGENRLILHNDKGF